MSNSLSPDQARRSVGPDLDPNFCKDYQQNVEPDLDPNFCKDYQQNVEPDLDPNFLQRLSADIISRQRVNLIYGYRK